MKRPYLFNWFKDISLKEFNRVYKLLDISFDSMQVKVFIMIKWMQ